MVARGGAALLASGLSPWTGDHQAQPRSTALAPTDVDGLLLG